MAKISDVNNVNIDSLSLLRIDIKPFPMMASLFAVITFGDLQPKEECDLEF
jgi:hypothetical protein